MPICEVFYIYLLVLFLEVPIIPTSSALSQNNNFEDGVNQLSNFIMNADNDDFLMNQDIHATDLSQSKDLNGILSEEKIVYNNVSENCCCQSVSDLKCLIDKNEKCNKSINKQIMIQLTMLNNSNVKLCKSVENLDHKLQVLMKSDVRIRHQAVPLPTLPSVFIDIMPVKSIEELDIVENYLSERNNDHINYKEELVSSSFIY